jgi:uncharacterized protein (DUF488 family)
VNPFFTIGHSTRSVDIFVDLLRSQRIEQVADVRTIPRSRTNPQYNSEILAGTLSRFQIDYEHIATLGGLRGRQPEIPAGVNGYWKNKSFHNYADYATTENFRSGLTRLRSLGHTRRCVVMCAEAVWWRCHRRIIADYLIIAGETVLHILGADQVVPAHLTAGAAMQEDGVLSYPAQ